MRGGRCKPMNEISPNAIPKTLRLRDPRTQKSLTRVRRSDTPPHASILFTLKQVFGSLWLAARPCTRGTTDRSISARRSLELDNQGNDPLIQSLCRGLGGTSGLRSGHDTDAPLNFLRSEVESPKHSDPERLLAFLVQALQPTRYENDLSGCGFHLAGSRHPMP
jgi:hypothetical protein